MNPFAPDSSELRRFHAGDPELYRELVARHSPRVLAYLASYTDDLAEAEDLAQEVWTRAFRKRTSFRGDGSLLAWLLAIARTTGLDQARSRVVPESEPLPAGLEPGAAVPVDPRRPPDERLAARERAARVREAVLELPTRQRQTVVLRMFEGRSTQETARLLGCAEGTVKAALSQALDNLATILEPRRESLR